MQQDYISRAERMIKQLRKTWERSVSIRARNSSDMQDVLDSIKEHNEILRTELEWCKFMISASISVSS